MNRAATEDDRALVWPLISRVLRTGPAPNPLDAKVVAYLDDWVARDAPRLDADNDGKFDDAGPTIMDAAWRPLATAVLQRVFGDRLADVNSVRSLGSAAGESLVDKDLRTLLGAKVKGKFNLRYCGEGDFDLCRKSLWITLHVVDEQLAAQYGNREPSTWLKAGDLTGFQPGLIPNRFRTTNRPTFQQVLQFDHNG
jgi:hypothetical protein